MSREQLSYLLRLVKGGMLERATTMIEQELAKPDMPTKIFGPNLEQILNAAGFYRREWVGLTDDEVFEFLSDGVDGREDINNIEEALRRKNHVV